MSVHNIYGSQNEFVESVTRLFILRMHSLGQNRPLSTGHRICGRVNCNECNSILGIHQCIDQGFLINLLGGSGWQLIGTR